MERSDFFIKLTMGILFVAVALYFGISLVRSSSDLQTAEASLATVEHSGSAEGWAVRDETVIYGGGSVVISADNGERVKVGGQIALSYTAESDVEAASSLQELEARRTQLTKIIDGLSEDPLTIVTDVSRAVRTRNMHDLSALSFKVEATVQGTVTAADAADELSRVNSDISVLESRLGSSSGIVYSPKSGIFTTSVDGFESVTSADIMNITAAGLESLFAEAPAAETDALGKIITGVTWYYAAIMDIEHAEILRETVLDGDTGEIDSEKAVTVQFTKAYRDTQPMYVLSIGEPENGRCAVIFACKSGMSDACDERYLTADIVFDSVTGIRIPSDAMCSDEGGSYVFLVTGLQAEKVYVTVLKEYDGYVFLEDQTASGGKLREGCEVITETKGITDGKVVRS